MKHVFSYLLVMAVLLVGGGKAMAQTVTVDSITYQVYGDSVARVTAVDDAIVTAEILSTVEIDNREYPVRVINDYVFSYLQNLVSATIPEGVRTIGNSVFSGCPSLTMISIPESVTKIGSFAFYDLPKLIYIYVGSIESWLMVEYHNRPNQEKSSVNLYVDGVLLTEAVIPSTVTSIPACAFYGCSNLTSVNIPEGVTSIGGSAFENCSNLTSVSIPEGVTSIGGSAFRDCSSLTSVNIPEGVTSIGGSAFYNCSSLRELYSNISSPSVLSNKGLNSDVIIYAPEGTYAAYKEYFANNTVIDGDINEVKIDVTVPGTLGEEILNHAEYIRDVNSLVLSGKLDEDDVSCIRSSMVNLIHLDLSNVDMEEVSNIAPAHLLSIILPNNCKSIGGFRNCTNLTEITLPNGVETIGESCFAGCRSLVSINIPEGVTSIGYSTFYECYSLTNIKLHDGITSIGERAFYRNTSLSSITIPKGVTTINSSTFYWCTSLASVTLHDNLAEIGSSAFDGCENLKTIVLPASLRQCGSGSFTGSGLTEVVCNALLPPTATGGLVSGSNNCTLYVPEWALNKYKLANYWNLFASIKPIEDAYPDYISIYSDASLSISEEIPEGYKPRMELTTYASSNSSSNRSVGKLTVRGSVPLHLGTLEIDQTRETATMTTLINHGTMTADSVVTRLSVPTGKWHFLSFPYDVKIADITALGNWVVRRYDGEARAKADYDNTWKTVPYDSTLHAGEGYIWTTNNGSFTIPAIANDNRNLIFASDTRYIPLKEHLATTMADNSWNLVGNPFPCYYDIRFMEYTAPITVRNGNSYVAYSPLDDSYILSPLEAFFVQRPAGMESIGFTADGRQDDNAVRTIDAAPNRGRGVKANRYVYNLYLENGSYADHTRVVINESASTDYEMTCDAAKFMSDDITVQQLFTIEDGERMAINERPMGNGEITLGAYFGKGGSYTIALDTRATDGEVVLIDKYTGAETNLLADSYTFIAEAGSCADRFAIRLQGGVVDAMDAAMAGEVEVCATAYGISVANATAPVYIYNAAGSLIDTKNGNVVTFDLPQGFYVVKTGDKVHKVTVKK